MITFSQKGSVVHAEIDTGIPVEKYVYLFSWECAQEAWAYLLRDKLADKLFSLVQTIRREEYEAGWSDAKSKRRKRDWFSGRLERAKCS